MSKLPNHKRKLFLPSFISFIFFLNTAYAQHENKNWYFGNGTDGIIFDANNNPIKISNKYPNVGYEGIVVVSDPFSGDLLFYTDGIQVINKNHNVMTNGSGLLSHYSGSQCVQSCRVPGTCDQYYIISNSSYDNVAGSFYYSIADFSGNSNGMITVKNQFIGGNNYHQAMRVIPKTNSNNYWLIGHLYNTATYHVYEITPSGFVGPTVYNFNNNGRSWAMKFDSNHNKLINLGEGTIKVSIFDFDPVNGLLSNEIQLAQNPIQAGWVGNFSPDGSKLYVGISPGYELWQYDFSNGAWTNMNTCCFAHDLLTGPNGITYFMRSYNIINPLSQINDANLTAVGNLCGYSQISNPGNFNGEVRRFPEFLVSVAPPVAETDTFTIASSSMLNIDPLSNDFDPQNDPLILDSIMIGPIYGTIQVNGNSIQYIAPTTCITLTDSILYLIKDSNCSSDSSYIIITTIGIPVESLFNYVIDSCNLVVSFINNSNNASSYFWNFGDGNTSTQPNPVHQYISTGTIQVSLIAINGSCNDTLNIAINLPIINNIVISSFSYTIDTCNSLVFFNNQSINSNNYLWNFGDGYTSTTFDPIHQYSSNGNYIITLISNSSCSIDTFMTNVIIEQPPIVVPDFEINFSPCNATVTFTNNSLFMTYCIWSFGDGSTDSSLFSSTHTYTSFNTYNVTLVGGNMCSIDTLTKTLDLTLVTLPVAQFNYGIQNCDSLALTFNNSSLYYDSCLWNFDDGTIEPDVQPYHIFPSEGTYNVQLIVFNECSSDTASTDIIIEPVIETISQFTWNKDSCFPIVSFINNSINSNEYYWDFGEGGSSNEQNPIYEYSSTGSYTVQLIINQSSNCSDTTTHVIEITNAAEPLIFIPNCFTPNYDGKNDLLEINPSSTCQDFNLKIFNRWGQMVYEGKINSNYWDGTFNRTICPEGVYFYTCKSLNKIKYGTISIFR